MGAGAAYVLPPQLAVESDGGIDVLHDHRGPAGEAAAPLHVGRLAGAIHGRRAVRRVNHGKGSSLMMHRRTVLGAAAGTLAAATMPRKPLAEDLPPLSQG